MLNVGCSGWAASQSEYFRSFSAVEINSSFYNLPLLATAARWKSGAPKGFRYCLKAWQIITHLPSSPTYKRLTSEMSAKRLAQCGHFRPTDEVLSGCQRTLAAARAMGATCVLFQTPPSFYPQADHLLDMQRFFKALPRGKMLFAWEPRGSGWTSQVVDKLCAELGLIAVADPLSRAKFGKGIVYCRMHGRAEGGGKIDYRHSYTDDELKTARDRLAGADGFIFFNNITMLEDATRFQEMLGVRNLRTA